MGLFSSYPTVTALSGTEMFVLADTDNKVKTITAPALAAALALDAGIRAVVGGTDISVSTSGGTATVSFTGSTGGGALSITGGTTTLGSVTSLDFPGGTLTGTSSAATLTIGSSGGGSIKPPACFPIIGEAFNWSTGQWNRPALSDMTVFFPASNAATITEIGSGLSGPIKFSNGNNSAIPILGQVPPSSGPWTMTCLFDCQVIASQGSLFGLIVVDSSNNALINFFYPQNPPEFHLQKGSLTVSGTGAAETATFPYNSDIATMTLYSNFARFWMRFRFDGSVYWSEFSCDGDIWQGFDSFGNSGGLTGQAVIAGVWSSGFTVNAFKLYSFEITTGGASEPDGTY